MDVKLNLGPENVSPALVKKVVRQGGKEAFLEASVELKENVGLEIDAKQVQRITKRIGGEWKDIRDREVEAFKQGQLERLYAQTPEAAAVMVDGGRILTRLEGQDVGVHGAKWKEPKYACCLTLDSRQSGQDPQPEPPEKFLDPKRVPKVVQEVQSRAGIPKTRSAPTRAQGGSVSRRRNRKRLKKRTVNRLVRTVVATLQRSEDFGYMVAAEAYRRGLDLASRKGYVCDGQAYNWSIWEEHFRALGFVPILDFLHMLTYLYTAAQAAGGGSAKQWERYEQWLRWAWGGQREKLFLALKAEACKVGAPAHETPEHDPRCILAVTVRYVTNNLERMDYPRYRKLGLPVSSAPVESLIKQFNRRVKGTEKFWVKPGAEAVLQVRAAYLSEDGRVERYSNMPRPHYRAVGRNRLNLAA